MLPKASQAPKLRALARGEDVHMSIPLRATFEAAGWVRDGMITAEGEQALEDMDALAAYRAYENHTPLADRVIVLARRRPKGAKPVAPLGYAVVCTLCRKTDPKEVWFTPSGGSSGKRGAQIAAARHARTRHRSSGLCM